MHASCLKKNSLSIKNLYTYQVFQCTDHAISSQVMVGRWPRWFGMMAISWPQRSPCPQYLGSWSVLGVRWFREFGGGEVIQKRSPSYLTIPSRPIENCQGRCWRVSFKWWGGSWLLIRDLDSCWINCQSGCIFIQFLVYQTRAYVCNSRGIPIL